jgi:hypothetical protein
LVEEEIFYVGVMTWGPMELEGCFLTRSRGGAEEDAEEQGENQELSEEPAEMPGVEG